MSEYCTTCSSDSGWVHTPHSHHTITTIQLDYSQGGGKVEVKSLKSDLVWYILPHDAVLVA